MQKIAPILGLNAVEKAPRIAVIRCNGSCENRPQTSHYEGAHSCAVVSSLYTGESNCNYGCLGEGDCAAACGFGGVSRWIRHDFHVSIPTFALPVVLV